MKYTLITTMLILTSCMGYRGHRGNIGLTGSPGKNCTVVQNAGEAVITCPDGTQAIIKDGVTGAVGPQGPAGTNATPVTMVKLCNDTATYPTVFVEYGMCLGGKLYAVYSQNGGFLAYLPNGTYHSNAIGSSCNLTVNGCTVSH